VSFQHRVLSEKTEKSLFSRLGGLKLEWTLKLEEVAELAPWMSSSLKGEFSTPRFIEKNRKSSFFSDLLFPGWVA